MIDMDLIVACSVARDGQTEAQHHNPTRRPSMRATLAILAVAGLLIIAPAALATNTTQIPGTSCSVTAYSPAISSRFVQADGGVSCGGSEYSFHKRLDVAIAQLVSGGWQGVASSGWSGFTTANPFRSDFGWGSCVVGRWYETVAYAEVYGSGVDALTAVSTPGSGTQCR